MATVAFIGSGHIGAVVARLSVAAGYQVIMSNSRGPQTLTDLVGELGPLAESWRREPGTPVYGAPYGPYSDPVGTPADETTARAALAKATR